MLVSSKLPYIPKKLLSYAFNRSRSTLYYTPIQAKNDFFIYQQLVSCLSCNPSYGHRRLAISLGLGKKRVRRVMRLFNLKPYRRKARWHKSRDERREEAVYINQIKGFCPRVPGYTWVCDFTYLKWFSRYIYLATVMDIYSREIVGWHISTRHTTDLTTNALKDALKSKGKKPTYIHSDQGSEYNSKQYIKYLNTWGINISMSKKASPWENPFQESFYNNFKTDLGLEFNRFTTLGQFTSAIHQTINYYNHQRIHTSLKTTPSLFAQKHREYVSKERGT